MRTALLALAVALPSLAAAQDAAFLDSLRAARDRLALKPFARELQQDQLGRELLEYLGWYDGMERQQAISTADMSRLVVDGLKSGAYTGLIMGESHGVSEEDAAGRAIVADVLDANVPVGAFLREENLFPRTEGLEARRVPVLTYKNQFAPENDVNAALKVAKKKLLISYTGCAHTSDRIKDFFLYTLEEGKTWHYEKGKRDMPTVEQSFERHKKKPLIVSMSAEETILSKIQWLFLKRLVGDGADLQPLAGRFDALIKAWDKQMAAYPVRAAILFTRSPDQPNLYAGLTPADRSPYDLLAARRVLGLPETAAWLAGARVKAVESLREGSGDANGHYEWRYEVLVHGFDGRSFTRTIPEADLRR